MKNIKVTQGYPARAQDIDAEDIVSFDGGITWNYVTEVNVITSDAGERPWSVVEIDYTRPSIIRNAGRDVVQSFSGIETLSGMALVQRQITSVHVDM